ncbi:MAG: hypothetical protein JNJ58_12445 [Chitinophagaceae bacterium]|nr:hypothetical protein [Chitinophagaceae bacterium]
MPYNNLSGTITPAQNTALYDAVATIKSNLNFLINLTPDERKSFSKMGDDGYSYVTKAITFAEHNANIIPPAMDVAEARKDLQLSMDLRTFEQELTQLLEAVSDTRMAAGIEAKAFSDNFYQFAKVMGGTNTPGMNSLAEDLGSFYEKAQAEQGIPTAS